VQPHPKDEMADAKQVAAELNRGRGMPGFRQTEQLVRDLNEIDQIARNVEYPSSIEAVYTGQLGEMAKRLRLRVDRFLGAVDFKVLLGMPSQYGWSAPYELSFKKRVNKSRRHIYTPVGFILDAAFSGHLRSVAQCNICQTWFVMRKKDHRSCSNSCREKDFRSSDNGRAKRASYMRRYRAGLRRRDRENLRISRKKS